MGHRAVSFQLVWSKRIWWVSDSWSILRTWPNRHSWNQPIHDAKWFWVFGTMNFIDLFYICHSSRKFHFHRLHFRSHSFGHRNKSRFKDRKHGMLSPLPFCRNWKMKITVYCPCFDNFYIKFCVLPTTTHKFDVKILKILPCLKVSLQTCRSSFLDRWSSSTSVFYACFCPCTITTGYNSIGVYVGWSDFDSASSLHYL